MRDRILCYVVALLVTYLAQGQSVKQVASAEKKYIQLQKNLASGWNTWNTNSVLSHVLLPEGVAINLGFASNSLTGNRYLHEAYLSTKAPRLETVTAGYHAYDGAYTDCVVQWEGGTMRVETAHDGADLLVLVTPQTVPARPLTLVAGVGMLWNKPGSVTSGKNRLTVQTGNRRFAVQATAPAQPQPLHLTGAYLTFLLDKPIGLATGKARNLEAIRAVLTRQRAAFEQSLLQAETAAMGSGTLREAHLVQQSALAWNLIYAPSLKAAIAPVSRCWNTFFGGEYVLFDWDTYLASYMAGFDNKALAYANAVEVTRQVDAMGMVPNYVAGGGLGSPDRSQPPVGSLVVSRLYEKYNDRWLLELTFDRLLRWNRWWPAHRDTGGLLCWGSDRVPPDGAANTWQGAAYESGLDNSPMYDEVPFNKKTGQMALADVGLTSLYVADCRALAGLAEVLGRTAEREELTRRAGAYGTALQTLWNEKTGLFLNRRTDTGVFSNRLSPTLFYPMLAGVATPEQARRMVTEHLLNPQEFWGEWVLPSIARNDPAFADQDYWRGRIWAPLNFLVYLGLRNYDLPEARRDLAHKSTQLLLKNWQATRTVPENFHATGVGRLPTEADNRSDGFYHWGALMGFMSLLEAVEVKR